MKKFIDEEVANAREALVLMTFGSIAVLSLLVSIFAVSFAMQKLDAQKPHISLKHTNHYEALQIAKAPAEKVK
jgi:NhaP-type Na+/H+ or K+/H+ antiporter